MLTKIGDNKMTSNIDKLLTQAHLMEVKVLNFSAKLNEMEVDIHNLHQMGTKYNTTIKNDEMEKKYQQLRTMAREWIDEVNLKSHRNNKIIILIDEVEEE